MQESTTEKKVKIGLVGLGNQALYRHLPALMEMDVILRSCYDTDPQATIHFQEEFRKMFPNKAPPPPAKSLWEAVRKADIVDVVIPPKKHVSVFMQLIKEKKPFICENPFCRSWLEALSVAELTETVHIQAAYMEDLIFDPLVMNIQALIASGRIGKMQRLCISLPNHREIEGVPKSSWRIEFGQGGALLERGSHAVGLAWHLLGEDAEFQNANAIEIRTGNKRSLVSGVYRDRQVDDIAKFELVFKTSEGRTVLVNIDSSLDPPWINSPGYSRPALRVDGTEGSIQVTFENRQEGRRFIMTVGNRNSNEEEIDLGYPDRRNSIKAALENAIKSIMSPTLPHPESSLSLGVRVQMAIGSARLSSARSIPISSGDFSDWCAPYIVHSKSPDEAWDRALQDLEKKRREI